MQPLGAQTVARAAAHSCRAGRTASVERSLGVSLVLRLICAVVGASAFAAERPNILLIVAEDLSPRIGAFGDPVARTPAIDALAARGVRFTNTFTASGVCAPSRSALITGVYPQSMGTHQMRTANRNYEAVPPPSIKAFPELLRRAGYATANSMKKDYQFGEPFTIWDADVGDYSAPADLAVWRRLPKDKPFFAMITLMDTHESRLVTAQTAGTGPWKGFIDTLRAYRDANIERVTDPARVEVPPYYPDTPAVRASIAQHYDNVHHVDAQVAAILGNLQADDLMEQTVVMWTTDHGDGLPRAKRSVYDSGLRVPLIVRYPHDVGRRGARRSPRIVRRHRAGRSAARACRRTRLRAGAELPRCRFAAAPIRVRRPRPYGRGARSSACRA